MPHSNCPRWTVALGTLLAGFALTACPSSHGVTCQLSPPPASGSCPNTPGPEGAAPGQQVLDSGVVVQTNLTFQSDAGIALQGDLYVPPGVEGADAGVVVMVHGGGWSDCNRRRDAISSYAEQLARDTGVGVFNVDYRLTQEGGGYPNDLLDVYCAIEWIGAHAGTYHLNGAKVAVVGESSGGLLALDTALDIHRPDIEPDCGPLPPIYEAVTYSAPTDLPQLASTNSILADPARAYAGPCDTEVSQCDVGKSCNRCIDASPTAHGCVSGDLTRYVLIQAPDAYDPIVPAAQVNELANGFSLVGASGRLIVPPATILEAQGCKANDASNPAHGFFTSCLPNAVHDVVVQELKAAVGP